MIVAIELSAIERAAARHTSAFATTLDGTLVYVNARYAADCRCDARFLLGMSHPLVARLAAACLIGEHWQGHFWSEGADGHSFQLDTTVVPRHDAAGEPIGYFCLAHEVTLTERPRWAPRHPRTADSANGLVGIFLTTPAGDPIFLSDAVHHRYTRLPAPLCETNDAIAGFSCAGVSPDADWRAWLEGRDSHYRAELTLQTREGEPEALTQRAVRVLANGRCIGIVGTLETNPAGEALALPDGIDFDFDCPTKLFEHLMGAAATFVRNLLQGAQFHNLVDIEAFLQTFATVALGSQAMSDGINARHDNLH